MSSRNFGKKSRAGLILLAVVLCASGCEYRPHKTYELQTKSGETIRLSCPLLDVSRNMVTYVYHRECYIVP
jgi:hypothetical protein